MQLLEWIEVLLGGLQQLGGTVLGGTGLELELLEVVASLNVP